MSKSKREGRATAIEPTSTETDACVSLARVQPIHASTLEEPEAAEESDADDGPNLDQATIALKAVVEYVSDAAGVVPRLSAAIWRKERAKDTERWDEVGEASQAIDRLQERLLHHLACAIESAESAAQDLRTESVVAAFDFVTR